ncbi:MAG TPA: hypothetical protein PLW65_10375 [Pseudomonadota bacterium]|nr:hypothetical protein [Pseudomonadota bacterium]
MSQFSRLSPGLRSIIGSLGGIAATLLLLSGCGPCATIGCPSELSISLDGGFDGTKSYRIDVNEGTATGALLTSCTLSPMAGAEWSLKCSSAMARLTGPDAIRLDGVRPAKLLVTVSADDTKLGEQMLTPVYASEEIGGRGCGVCTSAQVSLTVP